MPKIEERYALMTGKQGAPRLILLNEMCNPATLHFIENTLGFDLKGKKILDLGCGIGILSCELAKRSLPHGEVVAADISQAQLAVAEQNAKSHGLINIVFKKISAHNIDQLATSFDLIICRFVLAHLQSVDDVIAKVRTLMHNNSVFVCEEPNSVESLYCDPSDPVFDTFKRGVFKQVEASHANFSIGKSLHTLFAQQGLSTLSSHKTQASLNTSRLKQQLWQGAVELRQLLIDSGFASASEFDALIAQLKQFADTSHAKIGYLECTQIAGGINQCAP